jgi:hypothetical protein
MRTPQDAKTQLIMMWMEAAMVLHAFEVHKEARNKCYVALPRALSLYLSLSR